MDSEEQEQQDEGRNVIYAAVVFEGGLGVAAILIGWWIGASPGNLIRVDVLPLLWSILATLPMCLALWVALKVPLPALRRLRRLSVRLIRPLFVNCTITQLALISLLAGLGEELFFRGILQFKFAGYLGTPLAVLAASILFGLAHSISRTYFILSTIAGVYLGFLFVWFDNLLVPILVHTLYDFCAFLYLLYFLPLPQRARESGRSAVSQKNKLSCNEDSQEPQADENSHWKS